MRPFAFIHQIRFRTKSRRLHFSWLILIPLLLCSPAGKAQSPNCSSWQSMYLDPSVYFSRIQVVWIEGQEQFVLPGSNGTYFTSTDGLDWNTHVRNGDELFYSMMSNSNPDSPVYILSGIRNFQGIVQTSTDLQNWTEQVLISGNSQNGGAIENVQFGKDPMGNDVYVAFGYYHVSPYNIPHMFVSPNGFDWTEYSFHTHQYSGMFWMGWINGKFWGVGGNPILGPLLASSEDGINWDVEFSTGSFTPICFDPGTGQYLGGYIESSPETAINTSLDGTIWNANIRNNAPFVEIVFTGREYVAAGFDLNAIGTVDGKVSRSIDGVNWDVETIEYRHLYSIASTPTGSGETLVMVGVDDNFNPIIYRQVCSNCSFSTSLNPSIQPQGLQPLSFTALSECGLEPYTYLWMDQNQNPISTDQTLILQPNHTAITTYTVIVTDADQNEIQEQATVLASSNPNLADPNSDGSNTIDDLFFVGQDWGTTITTFDADGDGFVTVLDLKYVRIVP